MDSLELALAFILAVSELAQAKLRYIEKPTEENRSAVLEAIDRAAIIGEEIP